MRATEKVKTEKTDDDGAGAGSKGKEKEKVLKKTMPKTLTASELRLLMRLWDSYGWGTFLRVGVGQGKMFGFQTHLSCFVSIHLQTANNSGIKWREQVAFPRLFFSSPSIVFH